jgi:hypothetical protein
MFLICLGEFTNNSNAAVPWAKVAAAPEQWIKDWGGHIPVKEPTKMVSSDIDTLYQYLLDRQSGTDGGLEWIKSDRDKRAVKKGKAKAKSEDLSNKSDDGEDDGKSTDGDMSVVKTGIGEGSGSSGKRRHRMSGPGDTSLATKKQRKVVAEKSNTRYGAPHL